MRLPVLTLTILLLARAAFAQGTINVSGQALIYVVPDEVIVGLGIETFDASLAQAKTKNDTETATLLRAIQDLASSPVTSKPTRLRSASNIGTARIPLKASRAISCGVRSPSR